MELLVEKFDNDKTPPLKVIGSKHKRIFLHAHWDYVKLQKPSKTLIRNTKILIRNTKFNSCQIDNLSEWLTDSIMPCEKVNTESESSKFSFSKIISEIYGHTSQWDTFRRIIDFGSENSFISSRSGKQIAEYIILQSEERDRFSERIREELKISYIPTRFSETQNNINNLDFFEYEDKPDILFRNQVKNFFKRLLTWQIQPSRKATSVVQILIKFIITSRLFGIYVSEEDDNRAAIPASLTVSF